MSLMCSDSGQVDGDRQAATWSTGRLDVAAVSPRHGLDDRQTQTETRTLAPGPRTTGKWLKDPCQFRSQRAPDPSCAPQ